MPEVEKVTEDQAGEALQQLLGNKPEESEAGEVEQAVEEQPIVEAMETEAVEAEAAESGEVEVATEAAEDDLESLRQRLQELEERDKTADERFNQRLEAMKQRNMQNEQILRDRFLQKSNATKKALDILRASTTENGVSESEVQAAIREIEGTMNPASASFAQPSTVVEPQPVAANEDQALILNTFLNEKGMTADEADNFGNWIRTKAATEMSPMEQQVAGSSVDGFLRLAHVRYQESLAREQAATKTDDAVRAVKSVQRTQRAAAKAASASPAAPKKGVVPSGKGIDLSKLTNDDVSSLLRQSVEAHK